MSTTTFPKSDPVITSLAAANCAIRLDYDLRVHDFRFDYSPDASGNPALYDKQYGILLEYLGDYTYKVTFETGNTSGKEFMGSVSDIRIVLSSYWKANGL